MLCYLYEDVKGKHRLRTTTVLKGRANVIILLYPSPRYLFITASSQNENQHTFTLQAAERTRSGKTSPPKTTLHQLAAPYFPCHFST